MVLRQLGKESYGDCFNLYFATSVMKRKSVGAVFFMEKGVDQLQMAVGSILWEMRGNCQLTLLRSCENTFMLRDFICYQVGLALHITPQNRKFTEVTLPYLLNQILLLGEKESSAGHHLLHYLIVPSALFSYLFSHPHASSVISCNSGLV